MSTILNALKKLEKEKEEEKDRAGAGGTLTGSVHRTVSVARQGPTPDRHKKLKWRLTALVALVAGGTAVYFFSNLPWRSVSHPNRKVTQSKTSGKHMVMKQPPVDPAKPVKAVRTRPAIKATNNRDQAHSLPAGIHSDAEDKQNPAPAGPPKVSAGALMRPKEGARTVPAPPKQPARSQTGPPAPVAKKGTATLRHGSAVREPPVEKEDHLYRNAKRLSDGRLKVQAIAWSPVAQDRMAVMNDHIVHEGETVDGFSVVVIGQDDVVVKEKGQLWRVKFGHP